MSVLVTGAAGFIGSHTVDVLLRQGVPVIGIDNFRSGSPANLDSAKRSVLFGFQEVDISDEASVARIFSENSISSVIHLAAMSSVAESIRCPDEHFRLNVAASDALARAAIRGRCHRFVFASSAAVYGTPVELPLTENSPCHPLSPYAAGKLAVEKMLEGYTSLGLEAVSLRYFNVYGPRQVPESEYSGVISRFITAIASGTTLTIFGDGGQTRDFVFVSDVAQANASAALGQGAGGSYNVCTGAEISINALASELGRLLGRQPQIRHAEARAADIRHSRGAATRLLTAGLLSRFAPLSEGLNLTLGSGA